MPRVIDQGVCLRHWDWSETSQTVSILTREHGVVRGLAKGSRREKSPFSGGIEIATRGEVVLIPKPGALSTITAWDLQETFAGVRKSASRFFAGMYLLDLAQQFVQEGDPHPAVFDTLLACLRELDAPGPGVLVGADDRPELRPVLTMQWTCLHEAGLQPMVDRSVQTGMPMGKATAFGLSPLLGGLVVDPGPTPSGGVLRVRSETVALLRRLEPGRPVPVETTGGAVVERAARLMGVYIGHALGRAMSSSDALFGRDARG